MLKLFTKAKENLAGVTQIPVEEIRTHQDFETLFPINQKVRDSIARVMKKEGFNPDYPLILWKEEGILLDGHTRLSAAKKAHLRKVPVLYKSFATQDEAMGYAVSLQFNRRNLNDADLLSFILTLDTDNLPGSGRKQEKLARICNISVTRAMRILKVKNDATDQQRAQILDGTQSVHAVYTKVIENRDRLNSRKGQKFPKQQSQIMVKTSVIEEKIDEWIRDSKQTTSDGGDLLKKVEAVIDILPEGDYRRSIEGKLAKIG